MHKREMNNIYKTIPASSSEINLLYSSENPEHMTDVGFKKLFPYLWITNRKAD